MDGDTMAKLRMLRDGTHRMPSQLGFLDRSKAQVSRERDAALSWRSWYKTARWQRLRWSVLVRDLFTCQRPGCGVTLSDTSLLVADHKVPHRGDADLFWDDKNLQCLCKACHDREKQREEAAGRARPAGGGGV
jgi:5-methylcytosine-specific restriction endonuclease McrA